MGDCIDLDALSRAAERTDSEHATVHRRWLGQVEREVRAGRAALAVLAVLAALGEAVAA